MPDFIYFYQVATIKHKSGSIQGAFKSDIQSTTQVDYAAVQGFTNALQTVAQTLNHLEEIRRIDIF
jgi:hypothetical protein